MENTYEKEQDSAKALNPWISIWTSPKKIIRSAINGEKTKLVYILVIIAGILRALDGAVADNMGDSIPFATILLISLFGGAVIGIVGWWILSGLMTFLGKWVGGVGSYEEMKIAVGISYIPLAFSACLYVLDLVILKRALFMDVSLSVFQALWLLFSAVITFVLSVWAIIILIKGIAEVHRFSSWKGLLTFILPSILLFVIVFALLALI